MECPVSTKVRPHTRFKDKLLSGHPSLVVDHSPTEKILSEVADRATLPKSLSSRLSWSTGRITKSAQSSNGFPPVVLVIILFRRQHRSLCCALLFILSPWLLLIWSGNHSQKSLNMAAIRVLQGAIILVTDGNPLCNLPDGHDTKWTQQGAFASSQHAMLTVKRHLMTTYVHCRR